MSQDVRFHHVRGQKLFLGKGQPGAGIEAAIYYDNEEKSFIVQIHATMVEAKARLRNLSKKDWTLASIKLDDKIICAVAQRHEKDAFSKYNGRKISYQRLDWYLNEGSSLPQSKIDALGFIYVFDYNPDMNIKKEFLNAFSDRQRERNNPIVSKTADYLVKDIGC